MTLCECASEMRSERSATALVDNDDRDSIMIVSAMYEDQRPAKVSFITYKSESCSWVAGVGDLKLTSGRVLGPQLGMGCLMSEQRRQNRRWELVVD